MKEVSYLFGALQDRDVDALMRIGAKERLQIGATLITEGDCPDAIYLILDGALTVSVKGHDTPIASVGKGEIVGEMSLLESQPASATLCAATPVTVVRIARTALAEQLATDRGFSLRFYRALGMLLSHRLRTRNSFPPANPRAPSELVRLGDPALADMASLFVAACHEYSARPAYRVDGEWITYADCGARVSRLAASLRDVLSRHVAATGKQPVIAVLLPNSHYVLEFFFTAAVTHAIVLPLNHRLSAAELETALRTSGATVLLTSNAFAKTLSGMQWNALAVQTVIWTGDPVDLPVRDHRSWDALLSAAAPRLDGTSPAPPSAYLQGFSTSGTTGRPKTVLHSHANVYTHSFATIQALGLSATDDHCWGHFGPMFHVGDAAFVWIATLLGARHIFHENQLHFAEVAKLLAAEHVTIVKLVPSMLQLMCESESVKGLTFPDLRWILTGGAAPDPTLVRRTADLFGCDFIQGYGMTEATCHVAFKVETRAPMKDGLRILPGLQFKVINPDDEGVGTGEAGEIAVKGPTVFSGYVVDGNFAPGSTEAFTPDGYYRSGDLGYLDAAGDVHIIGRRKDMINVGGENVFAWEVEQVIVQLQDVKECAAFSVPHEVLGEVVEVAIVRSGEQVTVVKVKERCRQLLANFKVPHRVHFVDELPRTPTGKVRKQLLAEQIKAAPVHEESPVAPVSSSLLSQPIVATVAQIVSTYMATLTPEPINHDQPLFEAGLDSLGTVELIEQFELRFQVSVPPTLLYDHPTINELAAYFASHAATATFDAAMELPRLAAEPSRQPPPSHRERAATAPGALLLQVLGLGVRPALLALSVVPLLVLFDLSAQRLTKFQLLLTGPVWLALVLLTTMAVTLLIKLAIGRSPNQECELWSPAYFRWLFLHNLFRSLEIPLGVLRGTALLNAFYGLCGAKIGKGVRLDTVSLHDLEFIHIGDHTAIGRDVNLQPAHVRAGRLVKEAIHVGCNCFIGPNSSILGGAQIPDGTQVAPLAAVGSSSVSPAALDPSGPPRVSAISATGSALSTALGYLLVGYLTSMAIGLGILFVKYMVEGIGATVPSIANVLLGNSTAASVPLSFFVAVALAIYFVMPVAYFGLVVICKRLLLGNVSPQQAARALGSHPTWSHWLYSKLIDVPFFRMYLRLNIMSHLTKWNYQLLGSRIGARPFLAAPYTAEPELLEVADFGMLAGNVSVYGIDVPRQLVGKIRLGNSAVVANSCVLRAGVEFSEFTLLGDLSVAGHTDVIPPNTISVGSPPKVVGRTNFRSDTVSTGQYFLNQSLLVLLQWACLSTSNVTGFLLLGLCLNGLMSWVPIWGLWGALPGLLLLPRLVKAGFVPLCKWLALGKVEAGEHPAYGWYYTRWLLLETAIMDAESAVLTQLQGTQLLNLLWRLLGARVGSNTCILSSSLGCEFDLKDIGDEVVLQQQSLVFGHSIEHHSLLFKRTKIENHAEIGPFAIVEAGAVVASGQLVQAHKAVHAKHTRVDQAGGVSLINLHDFEREAQRKLAKPVFDYFAGGADDEQALERNRQAFSWVHICPRVLVDVSAVSTKCNLLGHSLSSPILIAPTAMQTLAHSQGESAVARSASQLNMGMILSMLSTTPLEDVGGLFRGSSGLPLFQLYLLKERGLIEELIQRAEVSRYQGLVVTVDAPVSGRREADIRNQFELADNVRLPHLNGSGMTTRAPLIQFEVIRDTQLTWESLTWIREQTKLPIWLKGILHEQDVLRACELGVDGVVLSNHGGRQLDTALSPLEVLQSTRQAIDRAGYKVALLVDGGIRRGSDAFKALALGADAVLVGRPVLWGLAVNGQGGVTQVLNLLNEELALTMKLAGCAKLGDITTDWLYADPGFRAVSLGLNRPARTAMPYLHVVNR
jgi:4-hydroxymandelate oxidase